MSDELKRIEALGKVIRDEIKRLDMPSVLPGGPHFGATEHDIARVAISYFEDAGWVSPEDYRAEAERAEGYRLLANSREQDALCLRAQRGMAEARAEVAEEALARVEMRVEDFRGQALSASRDSEACDPGDPGQGAYWDGQADAWLEAESSIRDALKEES